jgi:hypothetical protein
MLGEFRKTADRLDRRNLMIALYSFGNPALGAAISHCCSMRRSTFAMR